MEISTPCSWPECKRRIDVVGDALPLLNNHERVLAAAGWLTVENPITHKKAHYCPKHRAIYKEHND
jgi:hypothetical protein